MGVCVNGEFVCLFVFDNYLLLSQFFTMDDQIWERVKEKKLWFDHFTPISLFVSLWRKQVSSSISSKGNAEFFN